jgi:hypothetical protein
MFLCVVSSNIRPPRHAFAAFGEPSPLKRFRTSLRFPSLTIATAAW